MSIVSFEFLIFAICVLFVYFIIPKKWQWVVILVANIVFYGFSGIKYLTYMVITSLVTFVLALKLEKETAVGSELVKNAGTPDEKKAIKAETLSRKKLLCGTAVIIAAGMWVVLKYTNFFISTVNSFIGQEHALSLVSFVMPLGMSFYTFHAIGYVVDIYRSKYKAERNYLKYFTFVSYFPHIIQGPFSRFEELGKTLFAENRFSYDRMSQGLSRVLWGVFKKVIIADKLGTSVVEIFANYKSYTGVHIIFAILAYGIQLYADFSGYVDIVEGFSHILGVEMAENFKQPYFARTVDEFWRRWHITLGKWFKDYVFYPVSMGKIGQKLGKWARKKWGARMGKLFPGYFALIFVWTATGLWHGANWTFLVWGYLNFVIILSTMHLSEFYEKVKAKLHIKSESILWQIFCIIRTFALVCFFRFFSVAKDVRTACSMLKHAVVSFHKQQLLDPMSLFVNMVDKDIWVVLVGFIALTVVDLLCETGKWEKVKEKTPFVFRYMAYALMIVIIVMFAGGDNDLTGGFMYEVF